MRNEPTQDQINKLPTWARNYIAALQNQRDIAVRALNQYCDEQTESPFQIPELECTGEEAGSDAPVKKVRYIQTRRMEIKWQGVELSIMLRDDRVNLQWGLPSFRTGDVAFIPCSYQSADLKAKEQMR